MAGLVLLALLGGGAGSGDAEPLRIACSALGQQRVLCEEGAQAWGEATGHTVELVAIPNSATDRLGLYQQLLAAGAGDIDVLQIDVVWPGLLAEHLLDLGPVLGAEAEAHLPALIANDTVDGRLVAVPWFIDVGVLYYRADLLETYDRPVPTTWAALTDTAAYIQEQERAAGADELWGYVWQGRAYEGLTCNALEWIASYGGGTIVAPDGAISIDNPAAAAALDRAAGWVGTISPRGVLNHGEEEARGLFQSGRAVFMRNWPYAWALAQDEDSAVAGKIGVAPLPAGPEGHSTATLGGAHLAVSRYSEQIEVATDLVRYLTSAAEQKRRAIAAAFNPSRPALYEDPEVLAALPVLAEMATVIDGAVARPATVTGARYNRVSAAVFTAVHDVLSGESDGSTAVGVLAARLAHIKRAGW
ncbi:ABC transporter substrate-binding protein [Roseospira marina]|uniref:ABC transporter substrate-binding protein n=1 Tax=Roseospira marina TaxID=140057 RepID=UPI0017C1E76B|nr:ABC transporter substrate-binding protein [Roseospira marina]MBB4313829.1 trehalose/maltose transport system substrate-binding protein [Roseospira marina]MBB5086991.1 trehalose/maltose transport system substrate-binding protein [Roseospira marina]